MIALAGFTGLAGHAAAQPGAGVVVGGFEYVPLGGSVFLPPNGRSVPVANIGSSGQDGVEITPGPVRKGGWGMHVGPLLDTPGAECRTRYKGWDGLIYGNHRLVSNGDGTGTFNFDFGPGATSIRVAQYSADGTLISDVVHGGGSTDQVWQPNFTCPDGSPPHMWARWIKACESCVPQLVIGWYCITDVGGGGVYTYEPGQDQRRIVVTPDMPGVDWSNVLLESVLVTSTGLDSLTVCNAEIVTPGGLSCWGTGTAQVAQTCPTPGLPCLPENEVVSTCCNDSDDDGIAIDMGPDVATASASCKRSEAEMNLNAIDKKGRSLGVISHNSDPLTGMNTITPDFSSVGSTECDVHFYDDGGNPIGTTRVLTIGGYAVAWHSNCPPGTYEVGYWTGVGPHKMYVFVGCYHYMDFVLPTGEVITAYSVGFEPVDPTVRTGAPRTMVYSGPMGAELAVGNIEVTRNGCGADFNGDGAVDFFDYLDFVDAFSSGVVAADFNDDGSVDFFDYLDFVDSFSIGC